jgi:hypothetical protein
METKLLYKISGVRTYGNDLYFERLDEAMEVFRSLCTISSKKYSYKYLNPDGKGYKHFYYEIQGGIRPALETVKLDVYSEKELEEYEKLSKEREEREKAKEAKKGKKSKV